MKIDERANRFRPLLNDEIGRDFLGELVGYVDFPSQQLHGYAMIQHNNAPKRYLSHIPYAVLDEGGGGSLASIAPGMSHLGEKQDRCVTTAGVPPLTACAVAFRPAQMEAPYRHLCDTSVKYCRDDPDVAALYALEQGASPRLSGKGAGLSRDEVEALRGTAQ